MKKYIVLLVIIGILFGAVGMINASAEEEPERTGIDMELSYYCITGEITITWDAEDPDGVFDILVSEDGESFIVADTVENTSKYVYTPDTSEEKYPPLYFQIRQTVGDEVILSNSQEVYYYIDWEDMLDTDGDELPDVYEMFEYDTDPKNPDTDGDGLPDGYEVYTLGTDPTKYDSYGDGISDGERDTDEDGLSDYEEYKYGTDPLSVDTDADGLSDYEEIRVYGTDPLEYDTDGDDLSDGEEIALGLDPNNPATDGTPDNKRTFPQKVGPKDLSFYFVNVKSIPYDISVELSAAGIAKHHFDASFSGYTAMVRKNKAVVGSVTEISYSSKLKVDRLVLNYDLDDSIVKNTGSRYGAVSDEFDGIRRFNIFRCVGSSNMLLPVETFHDTKNNRVYAELDSFGSYCLVDMEKLLDGMETKPSGTSAISSGDDIDVIFVVYADQPEIDEIRSELVRASGEIFAEAAINDVSARIHFLSGNGMVYSGGGKNYAENSDDAVGIINSITAASAPSIFPAVNSIKRNIQNTIGNDSRKFCFIIDSASCSPNCYGYELDIKRLKDDGMDITFICSSRGSGGIGFGSVASADDIYSMAAGKTEFGSFAADHVFGWDADAPYVVFSTSLAPLPSDFGDVYIDSDRDYDNDGLPDIKEINTKITDDNGNALVTVNSDGLLEFPSLTECMNAKGGIRTKSGLARFYRNSPRSVIKRFEVFRLMPLIADPTSEDSDGDGIPDLTEYRIMMREA